MRLVQKVKVKNAQGIHARPATLIVRFLQGQKSDVFFVYKKEVVNARSIMSILMLAANRNSSLDIVAEGEDAQETVDKLVEMFEMSFGEE